MTFCTYIVDDQVFDADFETIREAQEYADDAFGQECDDESLSGSHSKDIQIILYVYSDDGERKIQQTIESCVEWEFYHGDLAEHGTWN